MEFLNQFFSYFNILQYVCESGNLELFKYLLSLNKIDITSKCILIYFILTKFETLLLFIIFQLFKKFLELQKKIFLIIQF